MRGTASLGKKSSAHVREADERVGAAGQKSRIWSCFFFLDHEHLELSQTPPIEYHRGPVWIHLSKNQF